MKTDINFSTALVRLVFSFIAGGLIGLERERSRQPAGLRTRILVCAGAVLKLGTSIRGITTAASIWAAAAVGLAIGVGLFIPAAITLGLIMIALILVETLEHRLFPAERIKTISLFS